MNRMGTIPPKTATSSLRTTQIGFVSHDGLPGGWHRQGFWPSLPSRRRGMVFPAPLRRIGFVCTTLRGLLPSGPAPPGSAGKLALFRRGRFRVEFVITRLPQRTWRFTSLWPNWLCLARPDGLPRPFRANWVCLARSFPAAEALAAPAADVSGRRSGTNWLCLRRPVSEAVVPAALSVLVHTCL